jgi:hypothetical protein
VNLDKSREIKQLKDEFSDLINEAKDEQAAEQKKSAPPDPTLPPPATIVPPSTPPGGLP